MSPYEQKLLAIVEEHGWHCTSVFDPEGGPDFGYSVGFPEALGVPDCIVVGLPSELINAMLWQVFRQVEAGKALVHGAEWEGLLAGDYTCRSIRVLDQKAAEPFRMNSAEWYWSEVLKREAPFDAFQIVWPSARSRLYPWDKDCPQDVLDVQRLLGPPPD